MVRTVFATFNSRSEAEKVINELKENLFDNEPSFIIRDNQKQTKSENCNSTSDMQYNEGYQFQPMYNQGGNIQSPISSIGNFSQLANQTLYNGYLAGNTIGGLLGLAASAGAVATIGAPIAIAGALSSMVSLPMGMQMNNPMTQTKPSNNSQNQSNIPGDQEPNEVLVTIQTPEEKLWQTADFLKERNAVDVRTS